MTLFGGIILLLLSGALAAWFSGQMPKNQPAEIVSGEEGRFTDPARNQVDSVWSFLVNERFFRNFIINMSFSGMALAVTTPTTPVSFFDPHNPMFLIFSHFAMVVICVSILHDNPREITQQRWPVVRNIFFSSLLLLIFSALVTGGYVATFFSFIRVLVEGGPAK